MIGEIPVGAIPPWLPDKTSGVGTGTLPLQAVDNSFRIVINPAAVKKVCDLTTAIAE